MDKYEQLWQQILQTLKATYGEETFNDLFGNLNQIYKYQNNHIYIMVDDEFTKKRINQLHLAKINNLAKKYLEDEKVDFIFITNEDEVFSAGKIKNLQVDSGPGYYSSNLNKNYTFTNYIVGRSNNYASKIAMIVADQLGVAHNPLYIFGDVGLGKTHLMQAIGNYAIEKDINTKVLYAKTSEFIEDYTRNLRTNSIQKFYDKYWNADVLLIDDVQMLTNANKSQAQFFKLFDYFYDNNKQIVITSDKPASKLDIMERLSSRFGWGLSIDIKAPDLEHRINILKAKLISSYNPDEYEDVPKDALEYIAGVFVTNVRELESALRRAITYCKVWDLEPSVKNFKIALEPLVSTRSMTDNLNENNYDKLQSIVSDFYGITVDDLIGKKRNYKYTLPRHISMFLIKDLYDLPYTRIGELFGNRDHTTVLSACNKIENDLETDIELRHAINTVLKKLGVEKEY